MTWGRLKATDRPATGGAFLALRRSALLLIAALALSASGFAASAAAAPNPITSCDQGTLQADLAAGGSYVYAQDCTVTVTTQLISGATVSIDGGGHAVTVEMPSSVQSTSDTRVLHVTGGNLTLSGLTLSGGNVFPGFQGNGTSGMPGTTPPNPTTPGASGGDGTAAPPAPAYRQAPASRAAAS